MTEAEESKELDLDDSRMTSQVVEIISGMTLGAIQSLEEAVQRAAASLDEGDDSVFYDEDEAPPDGRGGASSQPQRGDVCLPNFEAAGVSAQSNKDGTKLLEHIDTVLTKEHSEPQTAKRETVGASPVDETSAGPAPGPASALEEPVSQTSGKPLAEAPAETLAAPQTQPRQDIPSAGASAPCKEMTSSMTESQEKTPEVRQQSVPELCALLNKVASGDDKLQDSGESQDEMEENYPTDAQQDNTSRPRSSSQSLGERSGCTSPKSSSHNHSFSKYNTVSFRKIRRGNTRQKIDEFESMMNV